MDFNKNTYGKAYAALANLLAEHDIKVTPPLFSSEGSKESWFGMLVEVDGKMYKLGRMWFDRDDERVPDIDVEAMIEAAHDGQHDFYSGIAKE